MFKERSEAIIRAAGGLIDPDLPELSPKRELRSQEAIIGRMFANYAMLFSLYMVSEPIVAWLEKYDLMIYLSPEERRRLSMDVYDPQTEHILGWSNESLMALFWMLGVIDDLDFNWRAHDSLPEGTPNIADDDSPEPLRARCKLRPRDEIFAMLDLYYRLGWWTKEWLRRLRDGEHDPAQETANHDVVMERLRALDWAMSIQDWDEVDVRNR